VALPAYQDYTKRAKMSEVILAASSCRTSITEVIQSATALPDAGKWGCEQTASAGSSQYVKFVETDGTGKITVTSQGIPNKDDGSSGGVVTLKPFLIDGTTAPSAGTSIGKWRCGASADGTTVALKFLPGSCRGA
jgi:type IV pilus assembly protein PilA